MYMYSITYARINLPTMRTHQTCRSRLFLINSYFAYWFNMHLINIICILYRVYACIKLLHLTNILYVYKCGTMSSFDNY